MTTWTRLRAPILAAVFLATSAPASGAADGGSVFGRWVVESGKAVIEILRCGDETACGRLVWLANPYSDTGTPKTDTNNPDPVSRLRPLCGLKLISGLRQSAKGKWEDGEIYSTRDGKTYGVNIEPADGDRLKVRGFVGISLLGKSQIWQRDSGLRGSCTQLNRAGNDR